MTRHRSRRREASSVPPETVTPVFGEDQYPAYNVKCRDYRSTLRDSGSNRLKLLRQSIPRVAVGPRPHNHSVVPI